MEHIVVRLALTADQIASLDRMVEASGVKTRTALVNSIVREICADEMADNLGCVAAESSVASKCA